LEEAARISDLLLGVKLEPAQKVAAFRLKIMAAGPEAKSLLLSALKGKDEPSQEAAIGLMTEFFKPDELSSLLSTFNYILPPRQIQFISALSSYPEPQIREFLMKVISSQKDEPVRIAALRTLGRVGDATTVEFLAERAAQAKAPEKPLPAKVWHLSRKSCGSKNSGASGRLNQPGGQERVAFLCL